MQVNTEHVQMRERLQMEARMERKADAARMEREAVATTRLDTPS